MLAEIEHGFPPAQPAHVAVMLCGQQAEVVDTGTARLGLAHRCGDGSPGQRGCAAAQCVQRGGERVAAGEAGIGRAAVSGVGGDAGDVADQGGSATAGAVQPVMDGVQWHSQTLGELGVRDAVDRAEQGRADDLDRVGAPRDVPGRHDHVAARAGPAQAAVGRQLDVGSGRRVNATGTGWRPGAQSPAAARAAQLSGSQPPGRRRRRLPRRSSLAAPTRVHHGRTGVVAPRRVRVVDSARPGIPTATPPSEGVARRRRHGEHRCTSGDLRIRPSCSPWRLNTKTGDPPGAAVQHVQDQ